MPRWFSTADAAACVAAGVGAWFTRASLDVFAAPGGEARVAMLPAPVELVGLVTLACLSAFLLRIILTRSPIVPTSHLLLPLVSVLAIGIPYIPWLPDAMPAWRALAGPARFALWALVCGQVAWIGVDTIRHGTAGGGRRAPGGETWVARGGRQAIGDARQETGGDRNWARRHWPALAVFLVSFAAGAALAGHAAPGAFRSSEALATIHVPLGLRLSLGAIVSTLLWLWAERAAGSRAAATTAWLAIAGAAPFLLSGIFMPVAYAAAACVVLAAGWPAGADDSRMWAVMVRGTALAVLAWLDVAYVPLALVLTACLLWRMRHARPALIAAGAPLVLVFAVGIGPQSLRALIGPHQAVFWSGAAVLAGQQDGVLLYAPAVALAVPGLRLLWRERGASRIAAIEAIGGTGAALLTAAWQPAAARALALPSVPIMPALPLLVVPIACWTRHSAPVGGRLALARLLVLWGMIVTAALPLAAGGAALARDRDGTSGLLEWLGPSRELVRVAPIAPPANIDPLAFAVSALIWTAVAAGLWWLIARTRPSSQGGAAVTVTIGVLAALAVGTAAVEATLGPRLPAREAPALRAEAHMLDGFDARRRPLAVAYDRWRALPAAGVPPLFSFDATPGARRYPQPLRVLLNTRLSLPAGDYIVTLHPTAGAALNGYAGLQVGRMGPPMREWHLAAAPGESWTAAFTLPVDASFVGLRTTPEFERTVAALRVQPTRVVNGRDRRDLPTVLSSATYKDVVVTFHGDQVYAERDGFWVRGRSTLLATFAPPAATDRQPGVRLSLHGGAAATHVGFETSTWSTIVALEPGVSRELLIPALQGQTLLPVRITPDSGFVPAEAHGGSDRRLLGCWIEVLE